MPPSQKAPTFYGWKLALLTMFGNFMFQGGAIYLLNAFIQPFGELYGWTRGELGSAQGLGSFIGMASAPFLTAMAMKVGIRPIMLAGAICGGTSLFLLGHVTSMLAFTINFCVLWIAGQACGGALGNALMSQWFLRQRGKAFGMANAGLSMAGIVVPGFALLLITLFSVQTASSIIGVMALVILVPGIWLLVRDTPEEMGLRPDGDPPAQETAKTEAGQPEKKTVDENAQDQDIPSIKELLASPLVYRIGFAFAFGLVSAAGAVAQLKPRFSDLGFDDFSAMAFLCFVALCASVGKYTWGLICDKLTPIRTAKLLFICNALATLLAFLPPTTFCVFIFSLLSGFCFGGIWTVLPAIIAEIFGRHRFMAVYRVITVFLFLKSFGYIIMGHAYQLFGSYDAAYLIFSALYAVGFFLIPRIGAKYIRKQAVQE